MTEPGVESGELSLTVFPSERMSRPFFAAPSVVHSSTKRATDDARLARLIAWVECLRAARSDADAAIVVGRCSFPVGPIPRSLLRLCLGREFGMGSRSIHKSHNVSVLRSEEHTSELQSLA